VLVPRDRPPDDVEEPALSRLLRSLVVTPQKYQFEWNYNRARGAMNESDVIRFGVTIASTKNPARALFARLW
jgi:hypothetical protein